MADTKTDKLLRELLTEVATLRQSLTNGSAAQTREDAARDKGADKRGEQLGIQQVSIIRLEGKVDAMAVDLKSACDTAKEADKLSRDNASDIRWFKWLAGAGGLGGITSFVAELFRLAN